MMPTSPLATVSVDASEIGRRILHIQVVIPTSPGPLVLLYPQWIPGEHRPAGAIAHLVSLRLTAGGGPLAWQRDPANMYAFYCLVPPVAEALEATFDCIVPAPRGGGDGAASAASGVAVLNWHALLLYPQGVDPDRVFYAARVRLPAGWSCTSALEVEVREGPDFRFLPVPLATLVDSPVVLARCLHSVALGNIDGRAHFIDLAAASRESLELPSDFSAKLGNLVQEAGLLFGSRPYRDYRWLVALSDALPAYGLEHRESSDNRFPEEALLKESLQRNLAGQLAHEYVHSWNGKYRCPVGLLHADYQQPRSGEMLWVYEGLTQYLGRVLLVRARLWDERYFRELLATVAARMSLQRGRGWRSLADTAVAAQTLYAVSPEWQSWRRGTDFYDEGLLLWLEADSLIRQRTNGRRSLDDFCHCFFGDANQESRVVPYVLDEVLAALGEILPHDWKHFFAEHLLSTGDGAPLPGLAAAGWKLVYTDLPNAAIEDREERLGLHDWSCSIGLLVRSNGAIRDVIPGLPADGAGLAPGMNLVAVNGRKWSPSRVRAALRQAPDVDVPIELLLEVDEAFQVCCLEHPGGERVPHIERDETQADLLAEILRPRSESRPGARAAAPP